MKKLLLTLAFTTLTGTVFSNPVDLDKARKAAENLLGKSVVLTPASNRAPMTDEKEASYYLLNASDGEGFAIISAEDDLADVLGYSKEGHLNADAMPEALSLFLDTYQQYVEAYRHGDAKATEDVSNVLANRRAAEGYLVKSLWGQGTPYNTLCPTLNGQKCVTGCVATALAQLLYYWNWPVKGSGYSYATDTNGETYSGTLEHTYDWASMKNTTAECIASETASAAVAQLMYDCGLSVNMVYGTGGSSATNILKPLYTNFGYIPTTLRMRMRDCYATEAEWLQVIANEIDAGRPIYTAAQSKTGEGQDAAGHAFLIDGYNSQGYVHVNWGWNGEHDGFFALSKMNPASYSFTNYLRIVSGAQPAKNGETGVPEEYPYMSTPPASKDYKVGDKITKTLTFSIAAGEIHNPNGSSHTWSVSAGVYDVSNTMVANINTSRASHKLSLDPGYYVSEGNIAFTCKIPTSLANGDYAIRIMFKENGDWILPDMAGGKDKNAVYFNLKGSSVVFTDGADYLKAATSVREIQGVDNDATVRYYDIQGREVCKDTRGLLIRKQGSDVKKIIVK